MKRYVAGFLFSPRKDFVCLVEKRKPTWQAGKFNAIGGKVEESDNYNTYFAMQREFQEETGLNIPTSEWQRRVILSHKNGLEPYCVDFFFAISEDYYKVRTMEEERITTVRTEDIWRYNCIPNIRWIMPLCMDPNIANDLIIEDIKGN